MLPYKRTELPWQELQRRRENLSTGCRTLLLLLGHKDLSKLSAATREEVITAENIQILLQQALIYLPEGVDEEEMEQYYAKNPQLIAKIDAEAGVETEAEADVETDVETVQAKVVAQHVDEVSAESDNFEDGENQATNEVQSLENLLHDGIAEIKLLMLLPLQSYGGLLTRRLATEIEQSTTLMQLRGHQRNWLTSMFETKLPKPELNATLQKINDKIAQLADIQF